MTIGDEHCLAIGRISVAHAELEHWSSAFVWALIGPEQEVGQMVTAEMSFSRQLDLLGALFQFRCVDQKRRTELDALLARLAGLEQQRNTTLHSLWLRTWKEPARATRLKITAKRKKGLAHSKTFHTAGELNALAEEMTAGVRALSGFMITFLSDAGGKGQS